MTGRASRRPATSFIALFALRPTMIRRISVAQLRPGMYIHDLNCAWIDHNFVRNQFALKDEATAQRIRAIGVAEVFIDTRRGIDVPEAPATVQPEAPAALELQAAIETGTPLRASVRLGDETGRARTLHREANRIVRDMMGDLRLGKQIELEQIEPVVERIVDSVFRNQDALLPLARLKDHDEYTFQHSVSVCTLMTSFARTLAMPREIIREIALGALLHDVGKARVPDEILNKPAQLTDAEFERMKNHVVQSKIILQGTPGISSVALDVAAQHHERHDGTGYPNRLAGDQISVYGQMGAIVDVYDAITSNRVYRRGMPPTEALRRLLNWSSSHFDPQLVQAFIRSIGIYPSGSLVRLESGRLAVVQEQNADKLMQPVVKVIFHTKGHYLTPEVLDLRVAKDAIVDYEDFDAWKIDPARWLPA